MSDTFGPTSPEPLAFYDHDSSSWKMSQRTFLLDSTPSSVTLPPVGMTRRGVLYALPMSAPVTSGSASSSSPALPTPRATRGGSATETVELLRTPQAAVTEPKPGIKLSGRTPQDPQVGLADQVGALFPTPSASQFEMNDVDAYLERRARCRETAKNGNGFGMVLAMAVKLLPTPTTEPMTGNGHARNLGAEAKMLPTPRTSDANGSGQHGNGGADLRTTVDHLLPTPRAEERGQRNSRDNYEALSARVQSIGGPTPSPSPDTPPPSDDRRPTLWTTEDD